MTDIKQISSIEKYLTIGGKVIALVLAVYGGYKFIYGLGAKSAEDQFNSTKIETTVSKQTTAIDNLTATVMELKDTLRLNSSNQRALIASQETLKGSVKSLALKVAESPMEFSRIMEGKSFEVVQEEPMKSVSPNRTIRIIPIPKDSVK